MIDKEILDEVLPVPELEELKEQKIEELQEEGFVVTNFHSGGIFYTLLMVVLRIRIECAELFRSILNNMFVSHASGTWLDLKLADYGKKRKKAQKAQGYVTVKRSGEGDAIKIPKGHVFKTETDINGEELRFFVTENTVLQKGASSVDVIVEAEKEGSRYNVPPGQISKTLVYLGELDSISNGEDWIIREGSDTEDDESFRGRGLRSWAELSQRAIEDSFINAAESVAGVLFAQADCAHPRGQGTVDVIVTGTAGEATEGLLKEVRAAVDKIAGPYDNILVKSSQNIEQDIAVTVTIGDAALTDEEVERRVEAILTELLAVRKGRKLNELNLSDINHAIREGLSSATNVKITTPGDDVLLTKDKVITLGAVTVTVKRRE
nr:MAG TPA: Baseplate J like protein [Caudoviricetes sp.]